MYDEDIEYNVCNFIKQFEDKRYNSYEGFENYKTEILYVYNQLIADQIPRFPYGFWVGEDGIVNARIIFDFIYSDILERDIKYIPEDICVSFFYRHRITGIRTYHGTYYDLINLIYPNTFKISEFKEIPSNLWKRSNAKELAREIILYNIEECNYTIDDLYNMNLENLFRLRHMKEIKNQLFDFDAVKALNYAYEGVHEFKYIDFKGHKYKYKDEKELVKLISKILIKNNKTIEQLNTTDFLNTKYSGVLKNSKFKNRVGDIKEFYKKYKLLKED